MSKIISVKGKVITPFKIAIKITALDNNCLDKSSGLTKGKIEKKHDGYNVKCSWAGQYSTYGRKHDVFFIEQVYLSSF